jgi:hypothetical protein
MQINPLTAGFGRVLAPERPADQQQLSNSLQSASAMLATTRALVSGGITFAVQLYYGKLCLRVSCVST